jgi:hypothetical protein
VDQHQEYERSDGNVQRDAEAHDHDDGVGNEIAEERHQARDEGNRDHGLGERQVHAEKRQDDDEVKRRKERIERRDAYLGERHAPECRCKKPCALVHHLGQRTACPVGARIAERHQGADDHASEDIGQRASEGAAGAAQLARVFAQPR